LYADYVYPARTPLVKEAPHVAATITEGFFVDVRCARGDRHQGHRPPRLGEVRHFPTVPGFPPPPREWGVVVQILREGRRENPAGTRTVVGPPGTDPGVSAAPPRLRTVRFPPCRGCGHKPQPIRRARLHRLAAEVWRNGQDALYL
jgi:hypothetical protein